ncbi:MAG: 3-phosphoshikimate 1-carboxyvinyltransferase [Clostridia bacterium]|nr:3-phosphoshikimate 1-carboxyvinyltransferase [Clostridia bacterium]
MTVKIKPSQVKGTVNAPASKSMAHRLLICAGLAEGKSEINNVAYSEDILATLDCLSSMGAKIEKGEDFVIIEGASPLSSKGGTYKCRESGSTLRFFIPIAMLSCERSLFTGYGRLMERPMEIYEKIAQEKGLSYEKNSDGISIVGRLTPGSFSVPANISSQFISGLLFALPLCEGDSEIELTGNIESRSYIDMTIDAMMLFGVKIIWKNEKTLYIKGGQKYLPQSFAVEGDYSNAAFLDGFNLLGGEVTVKGLKPDSLQGDKIYKEYYELLKKGFPTLDIRNCPDLAPILMTLAAALNGAVLTGTKRLKIKESDRGLVMKEELSKFGADIEVHEDEIIIHKSEIRKPEEVLYSHNDHRVVMSLSVLCSITGGEISGAEAVKKSYPDFFVKVKSLGMEANTYDNN